MRKILQKFKIRKAMTLVELMIYLSITMIVLVVVIDLVTRVAQMKVQSSGQETVSANTRFLTDRLTYAILEASLVDGAYPSNDLSLSLSGETFNFTLSDGKIYYQENSGAITALTDDKVEIIPPPGGNIFTKITNNTASSVQIRFSVQNKQNKLIKTYETTVLTRGK